MTIAITGATGNFGRHAIESLLAKGVPATEIVGVGRQVEKLDGLGVTAKRAAYEDVDSLTSAFAGAQKLLFVPSTSTGSKRVAQHRNVVEAAKAAGIELHQCPHRRHDRRRAGKGSL